MKHMNILAKLMTAFALFLLANVLALAFLIADKNEAIAVADKERMGVRYLTSLRQLRELIPEHRRLRAAAPADEAVARKQTEIDLALTRLDEADLRDGPTLDTTEDFVKLRRVWKQFASSAPDPKLSADLGASIDLTMRSLNALVGDNSGLTLDPVLDTYYLMDVAVVKLSNIADLLNSLIDQTRTFAAGASLTQAARDRLVVASAALRADLANVNAGLGVATAFTPALTAMLETPRQELDRSARSLLELLDRDAIQRARLAAGADAFSAPLTETLARSFRLNDVAMALLDQRLGARANAAAESRNTAITYVAIVAAVGALAASWIGFTLSRRLRRLTDAVSETASGQRQGPVGAPSDDEIGTLTGAINRLVESRTSVPRGAVAGRPDDASSALLDENQRLKTLVADLSLENQALRKGGALV